MVYREQTVCVVFAFLRFTTQVCTRILYLRSIIFIYSLVVGEINGMINCQTISVNLSNIICSLIIVVVNRI